MWEVEVWESLESALQQHANHIPTTVRLSSEQTATCLWNSALRLTIYNLRWSSAPMICFSMNIQNTRILYQLCSRILLTRPCIDLGSSCTLYRHLPRGEGGIIQLNSPAGPQHATTTYVHDCFPFKVLLLIRIWTAFSLGSSFTAQNKSEDFWLLFCVYYIPSPFLRPMLRYKKGGRTLHECFMHHA